MNCRSYERQWRDLCVDRGMRDSWLHAMNSLSCWRVYSSCEGHSTPPEGGVLTSTRSPRIWFHASPVIQPALISRWRRLRSRLLAVARSLFPGTRIVLRCTREIATNSPIIIFQLNCTTRRRSAEFEPNIEAWFVTVTSALAAFDDATRDALAEES